MINLDNILGRREKKGPILDTQYEILYVQPVKFKPKFKNTSTLNVQLKL